MTICSLIAFVYILMVEIEINIQIMYDRLFNLVRREEVILFVGAGFSIKAGYPSGKELCQIIYNNLSESEKSKISKELSLPELTEEFVQLRGSSRNAIITLLKNIYSKSSIDLSDHLKVRSFPHINNIITTNYDPLFETAYSDNYNLIVKDADCTYIDKLKTNIFKIHGDLSSPDSIIITKSDYRHYFNTESNPIFWNKICDLLSSFNVLFIGYSFEDDNILSIIEKIKVRLGSNCKEMFLIAPNWEEHKRLNLNTYGVKYFNDTAGNFFDLLNENVKKNIFEDHTFKIVSSETFNKFCVNNHLSVDLNISSHKNEVVNIKPINNQPIKNVLTFNVNDKIAKQINNREFTKGNLPISIKGNDIGSYPMINIPVEELQEFEYKINDIVFSNKKDIRNLYIVKLPNKKGELIIKTPCNDLFSDVKYELFVKNDIESTFIAHTLLYKITIGFKKEYSSNTTNISWQTDFNESYRNSITAIHWTNLLIKLYSGGKFSFYLDGDEFIYDVPSIEKKDVAVDNLKTHIDFYENIEAIEKLRKIRFNIYGKFTERNYEYSKIVLKFLRKEYELIPAKNYKSSFEFLGDKTFTNEISENPDGRFYLFQTKELEEPIILNEYKFNVMYENIIYSKCKILNVLVKEDGTYFVVFENEGDYIQVSYTDKAISQEGL